LKEDLGLNYFSKDLDESFTDYKLLQEYIDLYNFDNSIIGTEFTDHEISQSEVLWFKGAAPFSYPEPNTHYLKKMYLPMQVIIVVCGESRNLILQ